MAIRIVLRQINQIVQIASGYKDPHVSLFVCNGLSIVPDAVQMRHIMRRVGLHPLHNDGA